MQPNNSSNNTLNTYANGSTIRCLLIILSLFLHTGCATTYYHNEFTPQSLTPDRNLPHSETHSDGLVTMLTKDNSIEMDTMCGRQNWVTIKTETNWVDIVIRAIANPIWGTYTVEYQCKDNHIANFTGNPDDYLDTGFSPNL